MFGPKKWVWVLLRTKWEKLECFVLQRIRPNCLQECVLQHARMLQETKNTRRCRKCSSGWRGQLETTSPVNSSNVKHKQNLQNPDPSLPHANASQVILATALTVSLCYKTRRPTSRSGVTKQGDQPQDPCTKDFVRQRLSGHRGREGGRQ